MALDCRAAPVMDFRMGGGHRRLADRPRCGSVLPVIGPWSTRVRALQPTRAHGPRLHAQRWARRTHHWLWYVLIGNVMLAVWSLVRYAAACTVRHPHPRRHRDCCRRAGTATSFRYNIVGLLVGVWLTNAVLVEPVAAAVRCARPRVCRDSARVPRASSALLAHQYANQRLGVCARRYHVEDRLCWCCLPDTAAERVMQHSTPSRVPLAPPGLGGEGNGEDDDELKL